MDKFREELFKAIEVIFDKKLSSQKYLYQIEVIITRKIDSLSYAADYQGTEVIVYSNGPEYEVGSYVLVLATNGKLSTKKFILGVSK